MWLQTNQAWGRARGAAVVLPALLALGAWGCRTPEPGPERPTDPKVREDPDLGMRVHSGSVLEGLPDPERGLDGDGRR